MLNNSRYSMFCDPFTHQLVLPIHLQSLHLLSTELYTWEYSIIKSGVLHNKVFISWNSFCSFHPKYLFIVYLQMGLIPFSSFLKNYKNSVKNTAFQLPLNVAVSLNFKIPSVWAIKSHTVILICGGWEFPTIPSFGLVIFYKVLSNILCLKQVLLLFCVLWVIRCLAPNVESTISAQFNLKMPFCTWKENCNKNVFGK